MNGMTTQAPSINFPVNGFGFLLVLPCERTVFGTGCLVQLYEGDSFPL